MQTKKITFQGQTPTLGRHKRTIEVSIRDTNKPTYIFQFEASGNPKEFELEFEDFIADLKIQFDQALEKIFGLQA